MAASQAGPDDPFPAVACDAAHLTPASAPTPFRGQAQANAALHGGVLPTRMSQKGRVTNGFACHTEPAPSHRSINPACQEPRVCRESPSFLSFFPFSSLKSFSLFPPVAPIRTLSTSRDRERYHFKQAFEQDAGSRVRHGHGDLKTDVICKMCRSAIRESGSWQAAPDPHAGAAPSLEEPTPSI